MKILKRIFIVLLACLVVYTPVSASNTQERYLETTIDRLHELDVLLTRAPNGLYGAVDSMGYIYEYALGVRVMTRGLHHLTTQNERNYYYNGYSKFITNYNDKYGNYFKFKIPLGTNDSYKEIGLTVIRQEVITQIASKIRPLREQLESLGTDDVAINKFYMTHAILFNKINDLIDTYFEVAVEYDSYVEDADYGYYSKWNTIQTTYKDIFLRSRQFSSNASTSGVLYVDTTKSPIENLLTGTGELTLNFIAILSASATYTPFVSYTGSVEFIDALRYIVPYEEQDNISTLYTSVKNNLKPLYMMDVADTGSITGVAKLSTIKDLVDSVNKAESKAFVTVKGEFGFNNDVNSWAYKYNGEVYSAHDTVTDASRLNKPVLMYSNKYLRKIDNMTYALLNNIVGNTVSNLKLKTIQSKNLFVNAFGDIVTEDNLVIVPGVSNPIIWGDDSKYVPYSVAFMNSYPTLVTGTSEVTVASNGDIGQFLYTQLIASKSEGYTKLFLINGKNSVDENKYLMGSELDTKFYVNGSEVNSMMKTLDVAFLNNLEWNESNPLWGHYPISIQQTNLLDSSSIFPYNGLEDPSHKIGNVIASSMFTSLTTDELTASTSNLNKLNDYYININMVDSSVVGTNNPVGYSKDRKLDYDKYTEDSFNRRADDIIDSVKSVTEVLGDVKGTLGIGSFYSHSVMGRVFMFLDEEIGMFVIVIGLIMFIALARNYRGTLNTIIAVIVAMGSFWVFIIILPSYIPTFHNLLLGSFSQSIAYESLMLNTENNGSTVGINISELDEKGNFVYNTNSITLHREPVYNRHKLYKSYNIDSIDANAGNIYITNQANGMFIENDAIKINTDILFNTLKIEAFPLDHSNGISYQFKATKTVSNSVDYYTPFYSIVDSLIDKINTNTVLFNVPRKLTTYNGVNKETFGVFSYFNSPQFLNPGNYEYAISSNVISSMSKSSIDYYKKLNDKIEDAYGDNIDFLGMENILITDRAKYTNTNWYRVLQEYGYYLSDGGFNEKDMSELIDYVNYHTRKFIFDNLDAIKSMSDETLIEIISLQAAILISNKVSSINNYMYPYTMTYSDITLDNVMKILLIDSYSKYKSTNYDLVYSVSQDLGVFNSITLAILYVVMFLTVTILNLLTPIAYLAIPIVIILRVLFNNELKKSLIGYIKLAIVLSLIGTVYSISILLLSKSDNKLLTLYGMLLICVVVINSLRKIITSIIKNPLEFGDITVNGKLKAILDGVKSKITSSGPTNVRRGFGNKNNYRTSNRNRPSNKYHYNSNRYDYGTKNIPNYDDTPAPMEYQDIDVLEGDDEESMDNDSMYKDIDTL